MTILQMLLKFLDMPASEKDYISDELMKKILFAAHSNEDASLYPYLTEMVRMPENDRIPSEPLRGKLISALHRKIRRDENELIAYIDTSCILLEKISNSSNAQDKFSCFQQLIPVVGAGKNLMDRIRKHEDMLVSFADQKVHTMWFGGTSQATGQVMAP